jgi:GNAT superfamily N-acetyltransferase
MFDAGDLFLIGKSASSDPVGFVGSQARDVEGKRVGFYSIGVLPEYRNQGIAKEAVTRLLKEKAPTVERVAALVVPGNVPSEKLASKLGIPVLQKAASLLPALAKFFLKNPAGRALTATGIGSANAALYDQYMPHTGNQTWYEDPSRRLTAALNFLGGALGTAKGVGHLGESLGNPKFKWTKAKFNPSLAQASTGLGVLPLVKVFLGQNKSEAESREQQANQSNENLQHLADSFAKIPEAIKGVGGGGGNGSNWMTLAGAGGLAAALGLGAYGISKALKGRDEQGRLKVTLPTKNPGDSETVVDLPFDQATALTSALRNRIELDARRRLYAESKERVRSRKPSAEAPVIDVPAVAQ